MREVRVVVHVKPACAVARFPMARFRVAEVPRARLAGRPRDLRPAPVADVDADLLLALGKRVEIVPTQLVVEVVARLDGFEVVRFVRRAP